MNRTKAESTGSAAIYCRVSTAQQGEQGLSLDAQLDHCQSYCQAHGLDVTDISIEVQSAKDLDHRPKLLALIAKAKRGEIKHLVAYRLDRFIRNTTQGLQLLALLARLQVNLHVVNENQAVRVDDADSEFLTTLKLSLAARERRLIGERTALALKRKRERSEYCGGEPPYGYQRIEGTVVPDLEEQKVIAKIRRLRRKGYSIRRIVVCLREDGHLSRRGKYFQKTQVERILAREAA